MRHEEADDSIRNASSVPVIENGLLADGLTDGQKLLVSMTSNSQKAATAGNQGIDACQIALQVAKLMQDGLGDLVDTGLLLLGNGKKLLLPTRCERVWLVLQSPCRILQCSHHPAHPRECDQPG